MDRYNRPALIGFGYCIFKAVTMKKQFGFSLMEVILAIGIISVIGVITSGLLTRTFRISSDAELISKLKQNGSVASNFLSETIRMADSVVCYGSEESSNDKIIIRTPSGKYLQFRFIKDYYIAKQEIPDSLIVQDPSEYCDTEITSPEVSITDRDLQTGVIISSGEFIQLYAGSNGKDAVTIKFDVKPVGNQTSSADVVNIKTTVQVR